MGAIIAGGVCIIVIGGMIICIRRQRKSDLEKAQLCKLVIFCVWKLTILVMILYIKVF